MFAIATGPLRMMALTLGSAASLLACSSDGASATDPDLVNLVATAERAGDFTTLLAAAEAAGLTGTLAEGGPFTVFAPTDAAFADVPAETLQALLADPDALAEVLLYHVVPGRVLAEDLVEGALVTTVEGRPFRVTLAGGAKVNDANIVATDVLASNGVIHVIDAVILPPEA